MALIDLSELPNQMIEIKDSKILQLLHQVYQLDALKQHGARNNPIIFGSLTNWKAYQALQLSQYVCASASRHTKEREVLNNFLFDEVNNKIGSVFVETNNNILNCF